MDRPVIAQRKPLLVALEKQGKAYFWCACGRSRTQPFCDGSHKGTDMVPLKYVCRRDGEEVLLCACKHTKNPPFCDGSHNNLADVYEEASADQVAAMDAARLVARGRGTHGRAVLDGGCYVLTPDPAEMRVEGGWRIAPVISAATGAKYLSQFVLEASGPTQALRFGGSEAALFVRSGRGYISIAGRRFDVVPETGLYVRRDEAFAAMPEGDSSLSLAAAVCPHAESVEILPEMPGNFDESVPGRQAAVNAELRKAMADRFYQVLIGTQTGSAEVTQFIGEIPKSRAAPHRHLYEEALIVLSGEGIMYTENSKAVVRPGDVIFLPKGQLHSLECTAPSGIRLMGAFCPAGSPAINY